MVMSPALAINGAVAAAAWHPAPRPSAASSSAAGEQEDMLMPAMYSVWQAVERRVRGRPPEWEGLPAGALLL
jgi:hypothetical protein